jgi:hypothetical protein
MSKNANNQNSGLLPYKGVDWAVGEVNSLRTPRQNPKPKTQKNHFTVKFKIKTRLLSYILYYKDIN